MTDLELIPRFFFGVFRPGDKVTSRGGVFLGVLKYEEAANSRVYLRVVR